MVLDQTILRKDDVRHVITSSIKLHHVAATVTLPPSFLLSRTHESHHIRVRGAKTVVHIALAVRAGLMMACRTDGNVVFDQTWTYERGT